MIDPNRPLTPEDVHDVLAEIPDDVPYRRTIQHRCPTCGAQPGEDCDAPRKLARWLRIYRLRVEVGHPPAVAVPSGLMLQHKRRQQAMARAQWSRP
jgi:hypothetical protein